MALLATLALLGCRPTDLPVVEDAGAPPVEDAGAPDPPPVTIVVELGSLQKAIDDAPDGATLVLPAGTATATPAPYTDPFCGNCGDATYNVPTTTTVGFVIKGKKGLTLRGSDHHATTLVTGAGYGIYIEGCTGLRLENLRVTGGVISTDTRSADGAIVVRESKVVLDQLLIEDHPSPEWNRGIGGVIAREGATVRLQFSTIRNITRNAVALYRGSAGEILGNLFQDGRQPALDITWNSRAVVIGNEIRGFWKGIGIFVEPRAYVANNLIQAPINGWGFATAFRRAGQHFTFDNNVIWRTSSCGLLLDQDGVVAAPGEKGNLRNNVVLEVGFVPNNPVYICEADGLNVRGTDLSGFDLSYNTFSASAHFDVVINGAQTTLPPESHTETGDPMLDVDNLFRPKPGSPLLHSGDPRLQDPDGQTSSRGLYGGRWAWDVIKRAGYRYPEGLLDQLL